MIPKTDTRPAPPEDPVADPDAPEAVRRVLGDAWRGWDASRQRDATEIRDGAALYIAFFLLLTAALALLWLALLWFAQPRLVALGLDATAVRVLDAIGAAAIALPGLLVLLAAAGLRAPHGVARLLQRVIVSSWAGVDAAGRLLRVSRDRLGHSYLRVTNRLALQAGAAHPGGELLILAPRCLRPDMRFSLQALAGEFGARCEVVGGGEQARERIERLRPGGVLAVACERDLVEGVRGVAPRVTVLSLPNRRPDGPCRNSEIDLDEARRLLSSLQRIGRGSA